MLSALTAVCATLVFAPVASAVVPLPPADDLPVNGLQGEVPKADQQSGRAALGYRKGLKLIGQNTILNRGSNFAMAWIDDCAYVTTTSPAQLIGSSTTTGFPVKQPLNGMAVIDAADATHPKLISILQSPAMLDPHETLHANQARKIIVATQAGALATPSQGVPIDVYDAQDCRHPVLKSTFYISPIAAGSVGLGSTFRGHAMCLSNDGMTAYATSTIFVVDNAAIDLSDLSHPKLIKRFATGAHDCGVSKDGNRLYLAVFGVGGEALPNGLEILDTSDVQKRVPDPQFKRIGFMRWTSISEKEVLEAGSHTVRVFHHGAKTYAFSSDEWPVVAPCPWAHGRIIDISDELHPVKVSDLTLDVQKRENCATTQHDLVNYSSHYVGFDDEDQPTTLFTSNYGSGLRVWDIHDPTQPKEIAYFQPAPIADTQLRAPFAGFALGNGAMWDVVGDYIRYRPESGQIWIVGASSGFQILQLTQSAGPTAPHPTGVGH